MARNTVKEMTNNFGKLDKFEGHDFRRWQKKMHFLLTTLKVVYVLTTPMPELMENDTVKAIRRRAKWENDDYICRGHILNEDASSKKFLKDFKHTLKHGKDDLSLVQLGSHLRIEESLRAQESDKGKEKGLRTNPKTKVKAIGWWIDSGAITHVCKDHCWFKTYEPVEDGSVLYIGDDHFAPIHGKGIVALEFSSEKTITLFNVLFCSSVSTPMDQVEKLRPDTGKHVDQLEYSRVIGCLMYVMICTRPDIAYGVGRLSRFTCNPSRQHWQAITRVFKYLNGTMNYGLSYVGYPSMGGAISWDSKKQTCIIGSIIEFEFVALAATGKKTEWLRNLTHEIPIWPKPIAPISIHCDSAATLAKAYSQMYNGKSRHLEAEFNVESSELEIETRVSIFSRCKN
uniref:Zinc finger, CCHC-type n=1 Tax=Tanacetum cinerariifolium TaxID=118510 RepID=A0A6L2P6Q4_TANCI|nr:zinc finger, CCHC-type [Tanacetum cinerariifolium]